jgi:hypothetical protein
MHRISPVIFGFMAAAPHFSQIKKLPFVISMNRKNIDINGLKIKYKFTKNGGY